MDEEEEILLYAKLELFAIGTITLPEPSTLVSYVILETNSKS
jgi:hypothetical protein